MKKEERGAKRRHDRSLRGIMAQYEDPEYDKKLEQRALNEQLMNLRNSLETLRHAFDKKILPSSKEWPSSIIYWGIIDSATRLDPLRIQRKIKNPFWCHALTRVNSEHPEIHLISTVESFVKYASSLIPNKGEIPKSQIAFEIEINNRLKKSSPDFGGDFKNCTIAFAIFDGSQKATGDRVRELVNLCSEEFKKLNSQQLYTPELIPRDWRRLVEFAAALEIVRTHQSYVNSNSLWLSEFSDFLRDLENPEFRKEEARLPHNFGRDSSSRAKKKMREQAKVRKRRQRERNSTKN